MNPEGFTNITYTNGTQVYMEFSKDYTPQDFKESDLTKLFDNSEPCSQPANDANESNTTKILHENGKGNGNLCIIILFWTHSQNTQLITQKSSSELTVNT